MSYLFSLALRSAWNRRYTLGLTLVSLVLATALLLGIARLRHDLRESFTQSVSATDLVVGPRGSPTQLMLYAVFHIGEASQNMDWASAQKIAGHGAVDWAVPLSLGDVHRGFPVLGTEVAYFERFRYGVRQSLVITEGRPFDGLFEAVIGAEVAERMGYTLGQKIVLAHGSGELDMGEHDDKPCVIVGILARTGTPVDRTVHISLQTMEALHIDWQGGMPVPGFRVPPELVQKFDLTPKSVTAMLVGLKRRSDVFAMQRYINNFKDEPLMAVMPGVTLDQLWEVVGQVERALMLVSALVAVVGLAGLVATILAGLDARRRELAILRSVGARPLALLVLLSLEGLAVTLVGVLGGAVLLGGLLWSGAPWLQAHYGITPGFHWPTADEWWLVCAILAAGLLASLLPGLRAYRMSLADGLSPRM